MVCGLDAVLEEFYEQQKEKRKEYSTLYRAFLTYANSHTFSTYEAKEYISSVLREEDIIASCVLYFENSNSYKMSAIKKYLNAMSFLAENCFKPKHWDNPTLEKSLPFSKLSDDVVRRLTKKIPVENASIQPISDEDFLNIQEYFLSYSCTTRAKTQFYLMCNLFLFLGFKLERIRDFRVSDYDINNGTLLIRCTSKNVQFPIYLPTEINDCLKQYLRDYPRADRRERLFLDTAGNPIRASFLEAEFKPLRKLHAHGATLENYNATGFAKYGAINLLKTGLEPYFVQLLTGMDHIIMDDCVQLFLEKQYTRINDCAWLTSFFNAKTGNTPSFSFFPPAPDLK